MERLNVWFCGLKVGFLDCERKTNSFTFSYSGDYLSRSDARAISTSLPLQAEAFDPYSSRKFFENLLPPEVVRRKLEMVLHVSVGNVFGCLKALGRDCAGAIAVYPEDEEPNDTEEERLLELSEGESEAAVRALPQRPLLVGAYDGFRMSAAGAQDKVIARVREDRLVLPLYGAASTDIVKPAVDRLPESVFNELFCERLAADCGIDAARCDVVRFGRETCYRTVRYDRYAADGRIRRWHQEDFCQMLGVESEQKYQDDGGPSIPRCFRAIREMRLGFSAQRKFLDFVIFNCLVGNADAHAKNFSVLYRNGFADVAPLYDSMSTAVYEGASTRLAMRVGNAVKLADVTRKSFAELASQCEIKEGFVLDELDRISERIRAAAPRLSESLSDKGWSSPVYRPIIDVIDRQLSQVESAAGIRASSCRSGG